ncbi:MAG: NAD(P)-dependent oxidoreductase [Candidatus Marinimicrobia bacterium]|nr:NAD(P)-dependent oxidoreductase [Candidatus Neomarinimicrobiota bacterium]
MRRILVTGAAGYIGSVLVRQLLERGYYVKGFDVLLFGGESLIGIYNHPNFEFIKGDVRDEQTVKKALTDVTDVVHLAAIVGDPACAKQPELAEVINWRATKFLYDFCNDDTNVKHFVFASTCSIYGKMEGNGYVNEESPLNPVSLYARLKVKFEKYLLESEIRKDFIPTALRFSTVYGLSPRMRFDLTVNEFIRDVTLGKELIIFGEQFWRPYCHVEDLVRSCILVLESPKEKVKQDVYGVGATNENYQKKMIAEEIMKIVPEAKIKYVQKDEDPRDYRVDFSKIKSELGFEITKTVPQGLKEIHCVLKDGIISDPYSSKYRNI